jgi:hypothetical protein
MSNSLYEQLKAGSSAEDIAAAFTAELNKAEEQLRAEREAEEKAKVAKQAVKLDEAATLLRKLVAFISYYYPSLGLEDDEDLTEDEYRALAELVLLMLDLEAMKPAKRQFKMKSFNQPVAKIEADKPVEKPALDDPFASFFKAFNL